MSTVKDACKEEIAKTKPFTVTIALTSACDKALAGAQSTRTGAPPSEMSRTAIEASACAAYMNMRPSETDSEVTRPASLDTAESMGTSGRDGVAAAPTSRGAAGLDASMVVTPLELGAATYTYAFMTAMDGVSARRDGSRIELRMMGLAGLLMLSVVRRWEAHMMKARLPWTARPFARNRRVPPSTDPASTGDDGLDTSTLVNRPLLAAAVSTKLESDGATVSERERERRTV